jgi:hypothetical protein
MQAIACSVPFSIFTLSQRRSQAGRCACMRSATKGNEGRFAEVQPEQNMLVVFPSWTLHEVLPVSFGYRPVSQIPITPHMSTKTAAHRCGSILSCRRKRFFLIDASRKILRPLIASGPRGVSSPAAPKACAAAIPQPAAPGRRREGSTPTCARSRPATARFGRILEGRCRGLGF